MDKREQVGVSEIFGYILLFGMVTLLLSLIYIQAMPQIHKHEDYANMRSVEGIFMSLKDHVRMVAFNVTPSKVVSLRVNKGSVYTIEVANVTWKNSTDVYSTNMSALVYELGSMKIYLFCSAVIECYGRECVVVANPPFVESYVPIVDLSGFVSFTGFQSLALKNNGTMLYDNAEWVNFTFKDLGLAKAWNDSLRDIGFSFNPSSNRSINITLNGILTYHEVKID